MPQRTNVMRICNAFSLQEMVLEHDRLSARQTAPSRRKVRSILRL